MIMNLSLRIAKFAMKVAPYRPDPSDRYVKYTAEGINRADSIMEQERLAVETARVRYEYESSIDFVQTYFPNFDIINFRGKKLLEIGSFTGGALVIWMEKYGFKNGNGIDVKAIYAVAGNKFAAEKSVRAEFTHGFAENLPYESNTFEYIFTHDVLEHVMSVEEAINECSRVLKPGGKLFCVFPPYYQPLESHLTMATRIPALHWIFSGKILAQAYYEVLNERGRDADWYAPKSPMLESWEKLPSLNGITVAGFRRIIEKERKWIVRYQGKAPILSDGRRAKWLVFRLLRIMFVIPARIPIFEELFLGRITYILEKRA